MKQFISLILLLLLVTLHQKVSGEGLRVETSATGYYNVYVNGTQWIRGSQAFFFVNGGKYTTDGVLGHLGNLTLRNTEHDQGQDMLGFWKRITYNYYADDSPIQLSIKSYVEGGVPAVVFGQKFLKDTPGTKAPTNVTIIGGFPNFEFFVPSAADVGYLSFGGNWLGDEAKTMAMYNVTNPIGIDLLDGYEGGPVCMFSPTGSAVVISPFNQFMSASMWVNKKGLFRGSVHWGIMGTVDLIPAGFEYQTIMYYGEGINNAFEGWGKLMRKWYGKRDLRSSDITLTNMGYWTDEGTAYHDAPEEGKDYEDTLLELKENPKQKHVPYKYVQLDDWLYERDDNNGTISLTPRNGTVPDGLTFLHEKTGLAIVLQNGFWSNETSYASQNGGNFSFLISGSSAVPLGGDFWDYLFSKAKAWGLKVYQQDWMKEQSLLVKEFQTNLSLGRQWLVDMGLAAERYGITIQYSGALPRHALQSLEIPAVTQARVSEDFGESMDQWKIGITSIFANALGLAPFKDSFISTHDAFTNSSNTRLEFESMVATISTGAVGLGNKIDSDVKFNVAQSCCNADGLILGPSRPATAIDAQIMEGAYNNSMGPKGEVWTSYSVIGKYTFGMIFSSLEGRHKYNVTITDQFGPDFQESKLYNPNFVNSLVSVHKGFKLLLCCSNLPPFFTSVFTSPVLTVGPQKTEVVLIGEGFKHVPISPRRVKSINVTSDAVFVTLVGVPGERLSFLYAVQEEWRTIWWTFDHTRLGVLALNVSTPSVPTSSPLPPPSGATTVTSQFAYIALLGTMGIVRSHFSL
ncbi:uncharacterized protein LOC124143542 [Haliotis rufescens]|uniref:uncharacterized protein LOC124143542 n=1 Tax=Haliotis rufescens TaxID=6454 RepID=UPI00201EC017|nr:uncharacterized protein LOC124143542 [Haliotis rufescens]